MSHKIVGYAREPLLFASTGISNPGYHWGCTDRSACHCPIRSVLSSLLIWRREAIGPGIFFDVNALVKRLISGVGLRLTEG
jgi:hypothetical protein